MPTAFISYAWESDEHKEWVKTLATRLRKDGVEVSLDQWELVPGDQIPAYMESAVRDSDFVLILCTPTYKEKSDGRTGGVGYEGDVITGELMNQGNHRKFIPLHRSGDWENASPSWIQGKYYIDLTTEKAFEQNYIQDLLPALVGTREIAPAVESESPRTRIPNAENEHQSNTRRTAAELVKITGINIQDVGTPRNDGTRGSGLYSVPFQLNRTPPNGWNALFVNAWNNPKRWTSMHRPGIAQVYRDKVVLKGTTVEEVKKYHRETLVLAVDTANEQLAEQRRKEQVVREREIQRLADHQSEIEEQAKDITF